MNHFSKEIFLIKSLRKKIYFYITGCKIPNLPSFNTPGLTRLATSINGSV
jgi:hypothetical protein